MPRSSGHHLAGEVVSGLVRIMPFFIAAGILLAMARRQSIRRWGSAGQVRRAIVGSGRQAVLSLLGPPRIATEHGETWYYPFRESDQSAMAVSFDRDVVRDVEIFGGRISTKARRH